MKRGWVVLLLVALVAAAAWWWWRMRRQAAQPATSVGNLDVIQYNPPLPKPSAVETVVAGKTIQPITGGLDVGIPIVYWDRPILL